MKRTFCNKKYVIGSIVILLVAGILALSYHLSQAQDSSWNQVDATYLAQRVMLDPTPADIAKLTQAGSAANAVSILFTPPSAEEETAYQNGLASLTQQLDQSTAKNAGAIKRTTLYTYQLIHNPNDVQQKLYYLWENTFSVDNDIDPGDAEDKISDVDVRSLDEIIYNDAYGNYPDMVKDVQATYAMGKYLDLISSSAKDPNENYSREMMQLFLMGQYTPLDTTLTTPNYSDADVNDLAYLLTGYKAEMVNGTNTVVFNPKTQYQGTKLFLGNNVSFPNPQDAITYIVNQRSTQVSEFLANKILKFYVSDNPEPQDIVAFAKVIQQNDFNIEPSLKWLFASDIMYRSQYMQEERYKSPVELVASYYTDIYGRDDYSIIPNSQILTDLGYEAMKPGSIFGRPGYTSNILFYSGTILDKWIGDIDRILRAKDTTGQIKQFLASTISNNSITTPQGLIKNLANTFYLGKTLPQKTEDDLVAFITVNGTVSASQAIDTTNAVSLSRMLGMLDLMLAQPEAIMDGGNPSAVTLPQPLQSSSSAASSTLVIVRLRGGFDYQQLVANISDPDYASNRKSLDLNGSSTPLGNGYVLNSAASALVPLIQAHQASFVTAVGLPGQVRAHDIASQQMETGLNPNDTGIAAALENVDPSLNLVSLTNSPPIMYKGSPSLQMGSANLSLFPELAKDNSNPNGQLSIFEKILQDRSLPQKSALYYSQVVLLNQIAQQDIAQGGKGTPGPTNATQFPFLESLIDKHIGNVYYLYADDTYDFHQKEDPKFDQQIGALTKQVADFYDTESKNTNLTIVFFSEFGRTDKINGNQGTDHGTGGGMTIISNVLHLPTMTGSLSPSTDTNNWTNVVVDERDVWDTIFNSLYNVPVNTLFGRTQTLSSYPVTIK